MKLMFTINKFREKSTIFFNMLISFFFYLQEASVHFAVHIFLNLASIYFIEKSCHIIWGLCNRKGGNCREKPNLLLYAKYVFYAEIHSDLALSHFLFFLVVSSLSIAKAPYTLN